MNFVRCEHGHFFDQDANPDGCPFCDQLSAGEKNEEAVEVEVAVPEEPAAEPAPAPKAQPAPEPAPTAAPVPRSFSPGVSTYEGLVAGWLVCAEGARRGRSFELRAGRNYLGTGEHVDVDLSPDPNVTQDGAQAALAFEPRNGRFSISSMQVRELTYVNDELLDRGVELRKGDLVTLGGTTLVFVPLCDATFGWDSWPARADRPGARGAWARGGVARPAPTSWWAGASPDHASPLRYPYWNGTPN